MATIFHQVNGGTIVCKGDIKPPSVGNRFRLVKSYRIRDDDDNPPNLGWAYVYRHKDTGKRETIFIIFEDNASCCQVCATDGVLKLFPEECRDICDDCEQNHYCCENCSNYVHTDDSCWYNDSVYCETCVDKVSFLCDHCGDRENNDDSVNMSNNQTWCRSCYDDHGAQCDACGYTAHMDYVYWNEQREAYYCESCEPNGHDNIHDYGYKPSPVFHRDKSKEPSGLREYYGIELEVEHGDLYDFAESMGCVSETYLKRDGSLCDETGVEIVSHPMTPQYMRSSAVWKTITGIMKDNRMESTHKTGMHVHVGIKAVTPLQWWKIALMMEKCKHNMFKVSGRVNEDTMNRWADSPRGSGVFENRISTTDLPSNCKRTCMLNKTDKTMEFRMFSSSTSSDVIMERVRFIETLLDFARKYGIAFFMNRNSYVLWREFLLFSKSKRLKTYKFLTSLSA